MAADFRIPWECISEFPAGNGEAMVREAKKEISAGHPLAGKQLETLARRGDCDDVLFELAKGPEVAVVHLTWSSRREPRGFPDTQLFANLSEFMSIRMKADGIEFGEE